MIQRADTLALSPVPSEDVVTNPTYQPLPFNDLRGWAEDDHQAALDVFRITCGDIQDPSWASICATAQPHQDAKTFFEMYFTPVLIDDGSPALFTGYYEPELRGSRTRGGVFQHPLYKLPPTPGQFSRREIEETGAFDGQELEIAWIDDPVDVFFLHVQGSGRIQLDAGDAIRVGYSGANGREYSSIGLELIKRGIYQPRAVSADVIRNWMRSNGEEGQKLMWTNESYVFFREMNDVPVDMGPLGAMNRSVTPMRTVAIDPAYIPYGAPVWIEKDGDSPLNHLMVAQDTGSAIRGPQRADIYFGTGDVAGQQAGRVKDGGRLIVLMPTQTAHAMRRGVIK